MDAQAKKGNTGRYIFRFSICVVVSTIAAKMVFILFWSFTFMPGISNQSFLSAIILSIGFIAGVSAAILCFMKLNRYLKEEINNI